MTAAGPRRHDRVWLHAGTRPETAGASPAAAQALQDWLDRALPLVCARQDAHQPEHLALGFTVPGPTRPRQRVAVRVPRPAATRFAPPLTLDTVLPTLPAAWQRSLAPLLLQCTKLGLTPRVYGAAAWRAMCTAHCLDSDSDLDLLFDLDTSETLPALCEVLEAQRGEPRLDGEIRLPNGWCVAWREVRAALCGAGSATVLGKSDCDLRLLPVRSVLGHPHEIRYRTP